MTCPINPSDIREQREQREQRFTNVNKLIEATRALELSLRIAYTIVSGRNKKNSATKI